MSADLVVGVDVGSQGTCAQAIAADGTHAATSYVPHTLSYPQPGWAEQDRARMARAPSPRPWPRCAARSATGRCARSRSARSSTGWWRPAPTASRSGRR